MSKQPHLPYDLVNINAERIAGLDDAALGILLKDLIVTLAPNAHQGLLEGAFELADTDAVAHLREEAWKGVNAPDTGTGPATSLYNLRNDEDLQEILAAVLTEAHRRDVPGLFEPLRTMGDDFCIFLATEIEDWESRYEHEVGLY